MDGMYLCECGLIATGKEGGGLHTLNLLVLREIGKVGLQNKKVVAVLWYDINCVAAQY